ncbi:MAG: hypothetical protein NUV77_12840, partial [Thermoguttaceae bacterium]|nr:hypothetical protein [Thermoguttaceae bacterium]
MPRILLCCAGSIALMVGWVAPPSALAADDPSAALRAIAPHQCAPALEDYTFMWWAYGWRGRSPEGARVLAFQTGRFGLALDVDRAKLLCLGPIAKPKPYDVAASDPNDVVLKLPPAELAIEIQNGGRVYRAVRARFPSRIIESGRFFQRCDLHDLRFADDQNRELAMAGRLEIAVWPDRVAFGVQVTPQEPLADATIRLALNAKGAPSRADLQALVSGKRYEVQWTPDPPSESTDNDMVRVVPEAGHAGSSVSYDPFYGWHRIDVSPPSSPPESLLPGDTPAERLRVRLRNDTDRPRSIRLLFAKESGSWSITGMSPMLLDGAGRPTGIPVQISKNWHRKEERLLYEGPWFHGLTLLRLAPRSQTECQFVLAYARWGGLPAASHAQLCLVGWGVDQLWDQAAIGSWGESICYDPDVNLNRAMIDDIRPLMVWGMNQKQVKWTWTNNVGGGDFLVYFDAQGQKQYLSRMRTAYTAQCPNLTEVTYAGQSPDGNLAARITVSTPAVDDYNRAFHRVRYDVLRKTAFRRLAFYQLGADQYNDAPVRLLARGNAAGLVESWEPGPDLRRDAGYVRTAIACEGRTPWFSLHHARRHDDKGGAWANRGLVLRRWNARLAGRDAP